MSPRALVVGGLAVVGFLLALAFFSQPPRSPSSSNRLVEDKAAFEAVKACYADCQKDPEPTRYEKCIHGCERRP